MTKIRIELKIFNTVEKMSSFHPPRINYYKKVNKDEYE